MKKTKLVLVAVLVIVFTLSVVLSACDLGRKLQGVELKFQQKLASEEKYSFDVRLTIQSDGTESNIDVSCFKNGNEYAYSFFAPDSKAVEYRRLFADNKLYEFASQPATNSGSYSVKDNVPYDDGSDLLYQLTEKIMLASYATLLTTGKKDKVGEVDTYRYDFSFDGNQYSLWFDDENLTKVSATFNSTDENGNTKSETYSGVFTNYVFGSVSEAPFRRPADMGILYVESPIPMEDWMTIITDFASRAGEWM